MSAKPLDGRTEAGAARSGSDPKHTPGPWRYQEGSDSYTHIVRGPNNYMVTQLSQHIGNPTEANARLIAAAPDLLDACKRGRQKLVTYTSIYSGDKELRSLLDLWDAAIAKAEGRS